MAQYREIRGDVLRPQLNNPKASPIIAHCCNDRRLWGAGFSGALSRVYPQAEVMFRKSSPTLGTTQILACRNHTDDVVYIANMIGQEGIRRDHNFRPPIRYDALGEAMKVLHEYVYQLRVRSILTEIHCPRFGSGLAGGSWLLIESMVKNLWVDAGIDVTTYTLEQEHVSTQPYTPAGGHRV